MPPSYPPALLALAHRQAGVVTVEQVRACGVTRSAMRAHLAAERWQRVGPELVATFTGPVDHTGRAWIAVLGAGPHAAISHASAAHRHGFLADEPDLTHVVVPAERRPDPRPGIRIHRSRSPRRVTGLPPLVDAADTLCDLASDGLAGDALGASVARAVQLGVVRPAQLLDRLDARGASRGWGELRALAEDTARGAHSALELRYLRDVERRHALPGAQRQARARRGGRTSFRDVYYAAQRVVVELDGRQHDAAMARALDRRRDRLAAIDGEVTLRYGWWEVTGSPCAVAAEVAGILAARGWTGRARRCRRCGGSGSL